MFIDITYKNAMNSFVYDKKNDNLINNCIWADDKTGEYCLIKFDSENRIIMDENGIHEKEIRKGDIAVLSLNCLSHHDLLKRLRPSLPIP